MKRRTWLFLVSAVLFAFAMTLLVACNNDNNNEPPKNNTPATHKVTFVADGQTVGTVTFAEGAQSINAPAVPAKEHYDGSWEDYTLGTQDITVNAVYTPHEYKITFVSEETDTRLERTYTVENKDSFTPPAVPSRTGYDGAWGEYELNYAENNEVQATYTLHVYKVTFVAGEERFERTYTIEDKDAFSAPNVPERPGYTAAWEEYELDCSGDIEVNAVYTPIVYSITYHGVDNAANPNPTTYTVESDITLEKAVWSGYTFLGWYSDEQHTHPVTKIDVTQMKNLDLWADWTTEAPVKPGEEGTIVFGSYPQTKVTEINLVGQLNAEAGMTPTEENTNGWTSYRYRQGYSGEADYMWYKDVQYEGTKYRGVYFTEYRPALANGLDAGHQEENGYTINKIYWFKFEPIVWKVLKTEEGKTFVMSSVVLDAQHFYFDENESRTIGGETIYPNNYEYSDIRTWLNEFFYDTAFSVADKEEIVLTHVVNDLSVAESGAQEKYTCSDTDDHVFLLSYGDINDNNLTMEDLQLDATDYAKAQGLYIPLYEGAQRYCYWWLRSPSKFREMLSIVYSMSKTIDGRGPVQEGFGVVPALNIEWTEE